MRTDKKYYSEFTFEGLAELVDWIEQTPRSETAIDHSVTTTGQYSPGGKMAWSRNTDWEGTLNLVKRGWVDGANEIHKLTQRFVDVQANITPIDEDEWIAADEGECVDVADYLAGEPECFRVMQTTETEHRVVDIWWRVGALSNVNGKNTYDQGVALLAAIDKIEKRGVRCGLTVWSAAQASGYKYSTAVVVKRPEQRLEMGNIAFAVAHPAYHRRLLFALVERQHIKNMPGTTWNGYGRTITKSSDVPADRFPQGALVLSSNSDETVERAYHRILDSITKHVN